MSKVVIAGIVTAFGAAKRGGYPGTYDEFCTDYGKMAELVAEFLNFSAEAETLAEGQQATASYDSGVLSLGIPKGDTGNGISSIALLSTEGLVKTYRITYTNKDHFDFPVRDGRGIQSVELNADYTLTLTYDDGTTWTSGSIRGQVGATPHLTIGTVETLPPSQSATAEITGTPEDPVLNLGIPKGQAGASDAGSVTYDPTETYQSGTAGAALNDLSRQLNDETTGLDTKAPVILETASGAIASFDDGADGMPIKKLVATIVPVQSGSGDPSPDNVRPISGWTQANIYNEETYDASATPKLNINWQTEASTVYGGTITLNEDGSVDLVSDTTLSVLPTSAGSDWYRQNINGTYYFVHSQNNFKNYKGLLACSHFIVMGNTSAIGNNPDNSIRNAYDRYYPLNIRCDSITTVEDFVAFLTDNQVQYVFRTAPRTYHFTNVGQLYTFLGTNNVWCDTGDITELTYPADTKLFLTARDEEITESIAPIENGTTASKAYAVGDLLVYQNRLYKVTSLIVAGGTLTVGTNIVATTFKDEIDEIASTIPDADDIRVSPEMALTGNVYFKRLTYNYAGLILKIDRSIITGEGGQSVTNNRGIYITGVGHFQSAASSQVPPIAMLRPIGLLTGVNALKVFVKADSPCAFVLATYWCTVDENEVVNVEQYYGFDIGLDAGNQQIRFHRLNIPENATHYAMAIFRGGAHGLSNNNFTVIPEFCNYPTT